MSGFEYPVTTLQNRKILVIGCGAVASSLLPLLFDYVQVKPGQVTVVAPEPGNETVRRWMESGLKFRQLRIDAATMSAILSSELSAGDICVDLSFGIDTCSMINWCQASGVLYINSSIDLWWDDPQQAMPLYRRVERFYSLLDMPGRGHAATAVVDHGANPGLISHFARQALDDLASQLLSDGLLDNPEQIEEYLANSSTARLARALGIKVIHSNENDSQDCRKNWRNDEFPSTWCVPAFIQETLSDAENSWGTHEKILPAGASMLQYGSFNYLHIKQAAVDTLLKSWLPEDGEITGYLVEHGETLGMARQWTVSKEGKILYQPTICYVYSPCAVSRNALERNRDTSDFTAIEPRILTDQIESGCDTLGALLMGNEHYGWWCGSRLSIEQTRRLAENQNATALQVAAGVMAALLWMVDNPDRGICLPDDLPYKTILGYARPFIGDFISVPSRWNPVGGSCNWQFGEFVTQQAQ